jgi:NAD+-dependent secondary alcohol dehydrogenase Adh1
VAGVLELTEGAGAEVVLNFVGERGAESHAWWITRLAASQFAVGYRGEDHGLCRRST